MDARALTERDELLVRLETELLGSPARRDTDRLLALLHPDFVEIGRSGRRFGRPEIVESLLAEAPREAPAASEWRFVELSPALVLVTYRLDGSGGASRHSSLWDTGAEPPVLRFHQGTRVAAG